MSLRDTSVSLPRLYACDECGCIGPREGALSHSLVGGHVCRPLTVEEEQGVREIWASEGRSLIDGADQ